VDNAGTLMPIYVIYVDLKPVYFRWSDTNTGYSFRVDSGYHYVQFRTHNKAHFQQPDVLPTAAYQKSWNSLPKLKKDDFEIATHFQSEGNTLDLEAGKEYKLLVGLSVKKMMSMFMINVPVPASCSYVDKRSGNKYEVHREYFKNETAIFCKNLPIGNHKFEIHVIPRFKGIYNLNAARIEMMYFPLFNANNEISSVKVRNRQIVHIFIFENIL
jgi:Bacterial Alpha-2-macroglobulin MG10 domain